MACPQTLILTNNTLTNPINTEHYKRAQSSHFFIHAVIFQLRVLKLNFMKKSAYEVWNLAKEQNLNDEQTKELMIKEGIIIKNKQEKTPIQKAISLIENAFENNEKNVFLREQAKRIRWKLENLLPEEKEHFINFYNQGGADMLQDETFGLQRFLEKYEDYILNEDERSN